MGQLFRDRNIDETDSKRLLPSPKKARQLALPTASAAVETLGLSFYAHRSPAHCPLVMRCKSSAGDNTETPNRFPAATKCFLLLVTKISVRPSIANSKIISSFGSGDNGRILATTSTG